VAKVVSLKAELAVLRGITHKDKRIAGACLTGVDRTYFHSDESVEIFEAVQRIYVETGESPSYRLVLEDPELSDDARSHFRESSAVIRSVDEAQRAVRILNKYRQTRGLYNLAAHIGEKLKASKVDVDALLSDTSSAVGAIHARKNTADAFLHFGKNNNSNAFVKDMLYGDVAEDVIPTGIAPFDEASGGLMRGSLVTIGATSGSGKSLVANAMGMFQASLGYKVVIVPLEMSKKEQSARMLASISGIDVTRILHQKISEAEKSLIYKKYRRWVLRVKEKGGRYTTFKPQEDMTMEEVLASVNAYDCDVVIVDYISLLKGVDGDDQWRALGAAARYAKINAENTGRVNVILCQVSEELKIRYARALSEHSTNSFIWHAPKAEREREIGVITMEQPKSRNSRSFPLKVGFKWHTMQIVPVSTEDESLGTVDRSKKNMKNLAAEADV